MAGNKYFIVRSVGVTVNVECACLCVHALQPMEWDECDSIPVGNKELVK